MAEPTGATQRYQTTLRAAYNAPRKVRGSLTIRLDKDMPWYAPVSGKRGHQRTFYDAAIPSCLSIQCLFGLTLHQRLRQRLVERLLRRAGRDRKVPDFRAVCRHQKHLPVQLPYRASISALDLPVEGAGIKFLGEGECKRKKHVSTAGSGARGTLGLTPTRWRFGPSK